MMLIPVLLLIASAHSLHPMPNRADARPAWGKARMGVDLIASLPEEEEDFLRRKFSAIPAGKSASDPSDRALHSGRELGNFLAYRATAEVGLLSGDGIPPSHRPLTFPLRV